MKVAVTGGTGFVARGVIEACVAAGMGCRAISRSDRPDWSAQAVEWVTVPSYDDEEALTGALSDIDCVVHLAANPDRMAASDVEETENQTRALINAQRASGTKRAIVASSVYARKPATTGSYGKAKQTMENQFLAAGDLQTVILRLPPVYGPGGKGGAATLAKMVRRGLPLPLGAATAERAYISRTNLASLIVTIASASQENWQSAAGGIFEPSDGTVVATRDLVRMMAAQLGVPLRLLSVPTGLLRLAAGAVRKSELVAGAFDELTVEPVAALDRAFGWRPIEHMPESLRFLSEPNPT